VLLRDTRVLPLPSMRDTFLFGGHLLGSGLATPGMHAPFSYGGGLREHRSEVGLAVVLRGLTRGLTRVVLWLRAVVLQDPHVFVDTYFRPMSPFGTSSLWDHTKSGLYVPGHRSKFCRISPLGTSSLWDHTKSGRYVPGYRSEFGPIALFGTASLGVPPRSRWDVQGHRSEVSLLLAHRRRTRGLAPVVLFRDPGMFESSAVKT